ncbi:BZ3500_MvSof-1268-A1-R1_Chr10-1g02722 [Microbotryum saponariae]|uniref:BZ3500_MvSof-1268-A1-R1_Chr10-1g02722 protein n=1 Tax=Microbotryum saponariae TaxID=289078 RepID=A0A2X0LGY9_9BASI|nr:BZ3500_MvSof-1268-A1-R1_Chr10-1g02722 [Microbotryum saponariae]SDA06211.1 BZ3501_MvSof-1269-A2-R1_Chr10-1g02323 [Microbotryum saponariae]
MRSIPTRQLEQVHTTSHRNGTLETMTIKMIRQRLDEDHGWTCEDEEWKELKGDIKQWWAQQDVPTTSPASSPVKKSVGKKGTTTKAKAKTSDVEEHEQEVKPPTKKSKPKASTKYDRAANKNLNTFVGAVFGGSGALGDMDDEDDEVDEDENDMDDFIEPEEGRLGRPDNGGSGSDDDDDNTASETSTPPAQSKSGKPAVREANSEVQSKKASKKSSTSTSFKSAETIDDSDDSSATPRKQRRAVASDAEDGEEKPRKKKKRASEDSSSKNKTGSAKEKGMTSKKSSASGPAPKEGDAEKGTDEEEARIKKLKGLVAASGTTRPFNASTGAERTLSVKARTDLLEGLLREAGLKCGSGLRGMLPSLAHAKKVGEKRELMREMEELSGAPILTGLRTGKKLPTRAADDDDDDTRSGSDTEGEGKVVAPKRKFGAFLGDQSSDSE